MDDLGTRIRRRRERLKLAQDTVAAAADISPAYLCRIELGNRVPTLDVLGRIASALGTTSAALLRSVA